MAEYSGLGLGRWWTQQRMTNSGGRPPEVTCTGSEWGGFSAEGCVHSQCEGSGEAGSWGNWERQARMLEAGTVTVSRAQRTVSGHHVCSEDSRTHILCLPGPGHATLKARDT